MENKLITMKSQVDIPEEVNIKLRKYAIDTKLGSREKAIIYILKNFLNEMYKDKK
jgi:hypothetical protein